MKNTTSKREIGVADNALHYLIYKTPHSPSGFTVETRWGAGSYHSHNDAQIYLNFWAQHPSPLGDKMAANARAFMAGNTEAGKPDPFATVADAWRS